MCILFYIIGTLVFFTVIYLFLKRKRSQKVPVLDEKWWGLGSPKPEDTTIRPFKIDISDNIIKDLYNRLNNALPFHPPLEDAKQHYGINTNLLETIVDYWKNKYNWNERQNFLNQFPQFKTNIQGLDIHFLHVKPENVPDGVEIVPILLSHGWPGSVREFYEIIPILTTPQAGRDFVFEVVAPSLPGYGFSDAAVRPGLGAARISEIFHKLMLRLKFQKYYVQGGDWGSTISHCLAVLHPDNVLGIHKNWCITNVLLHWKTYVGILFPSLFFSEKETKIIYPIGKVFNHMVLETGYMHLQSSKPDTVGVALRDSPVGLAAYIIEKFITWTNPDWKDLPDGGLTKKFTLDQLLDNVMIYWVTRSITTSVRLYAENFTKEYRSLNIDRLPVIVPSGCNRFRNEMTYSPEFLIRAVHPNLIHLTDFEDGGHFAALELPEVLGKDIFEFVDKVRNLSKEEHNKEQ